jgi:hypothetical protein
MQKMTILGNPEAPITLVEYRSYFLNAGHAAHEVIINLLDQKQYCHSIN